MKKIILFLAMIVFLAACGGEDAESNNETENENVNTEEQTEPETEEVESEENEENTEVSDTSFDNGEYVYEIKEIEQMESQFGDGTQILAIEISFTNNTEEPVSPWFALGLHAEQETDTTVETLTGANGLFPEDYKPDLVKMGDTDVKPGATVDAVIGFEILYPGSPVRLTNFSFTDEILFERIVDTTEQ